MSDTSITHASFTPLPLLSAGNIVTAALRLYFLRFKQYFKQSVLAHLWLLIPFYGWAKYLARQAMISRLVFAELMHQPEQIAIARQRTNARTWSLVGVQLGVMIAMIVGFLFALLVIFFLILFIALASLVLGSRISPTNPWPWFIYPIVIFIYVFIPVVLNWVYARCVVAEVALAIESNMTMMKSLRRSFSLSQPILNTFRIQGILLVGFAITIPIFFFGSYFPFALLLTLFGMILRLIQSPLSESSTEIMIPIFIYGLFIFASILMMPFWQSLKAVLYYDLCNRREGFMLNLRDHR
jgi:hypothetical protein